MITDTRERIVETARRLFWEQGFEATGVAQILNEANVRSGSLYYFFPTKNDLLLAVLDQYTEMLEPMVVRPVFDKVSDPIERVFGILAGYRMLLVQSGYQHGCPIGNLALEVGNDQPAARQRIAANFTGWRNVIEQCLVEARLGRPAERAQLALFVLTTMEGAVMLARTYRSLEPYDAAIAALRDYFQHLLRDRRRRRRATHS